MKRILMNKDTELITCYQIRNDMIRHDSILDYLIMNVDRHLNNFGIIRDVNNLKWLDVAPIFDNGQSLHIEYYDEDELVVSSKGKFFYQTKRFDEIIKVVKDIERINLICSLLNNRVNKLRELIEMS